MCILMYFMYQIIQSDLLVLPGPSPGPQHGAATSPSPVDASRWLRSMGGSQGRSLMAEPTVV